MKVNLEGKCAAVTGAARGIGQSIRHPHCQRSQGCLRRHRYHDREETAAKSPGSVARTGTVGHGSRRVVLRGPRERIYHRPNIVLDGGWSAGWFFRDF